MLLKVHSMVICWKIFRPDLLPDLCIGVTLLNFDEKGKWPVEMLRLSLFLTVLVKTGAASLTSSAGYSSIPVALFSLRFPISYITFTSVISGMMQNLLDG